jgi:hypothetical protein
MDGWVDGEERGLRGCAVVSFVVVTAVVVE